MKGFFKVIGIITTVFASVMALLVLADKYVNRNRLEGDYLDCDLPEEITDES